MTQSATTDWASRLGKGVGSYWGGQTTGASPKVLSLVDDSPATAQVSFSSLGDILNYGGATDYRGPRQHASFTDPIMQTFGAVTGQEWTPQDSLRYGAPAPARRRRSILGSSVGPASLPGGAPPREEIPTPTGASPFGDAINILQDRDLLASIQATGPSYLVNALANAQGIFAPVSDRLSSYQATLGDGQGVGNIINQLILSGTKSGNTFREDVQALDPAMEELDRAFQRYQQEQAAIARGEELPSDSERFTQDIMTDAARLAETDPEAAQKLQRKAEAAQTAFKQSGASSKEYKDAMNALSKEWQGLSAKRKSEFATMTDETKRRGQAIVDRIMGREDVTSDRIRRQFERASAAEKSRMQRIGLGGTTAGVANEQRLQQRLGESLARDAAQRYDAVTAAQERSDQNVLGAMLRQAQIGQREQDQALALQQQLAGVPLRNILSTGERLAISQDLAKDIATG